MVKVWSESSLSTAHHQTSSPDSYIIALHPKAFHDGINLSSMLKPGCSGFRIACRLGQVVQKSPEQLVTTTLEDGG